MKTPLTIATTELQDKAQPDIKQCWLVYMLLVSDNSLYTGICTDIERRFNEHASGKGAKYFRGKTPVRVCYLESCADRSSASKREWAIKQLTKTQKLQLIDQYLP